MIVDVAQKIRATRTGSDENFKAQKRRTAIIRTKSETCGLLATLKVKIHRASVELDRAKRAEGIDLRTDYGEDGLPAAPRAPTPSRVVPKVTMPDPEAALIAMVDGMSALHDRYAQFAKDPTRIHSMRHMAADVARDIAALLKGRQP